MAKDNILEYDIAAAANNSDIGGINILGTAPVSNFDNAFREIMLDIGTAITRHVAKAAGSYTPVKADHNQLWRATGAVTLNLTAAATLTTGWALWVKADGGAITVDPSGAETINGAATLTVADGSGAFIVCTGTAFFAIVLGASAPLTLTSASAGTLLTLESSDAGAANGPGINLYRNSASPAVSDIIGLILWSGRDSAANVQNYGDMYGLIVDPTSGSEDFSLNWETLVAGSNGLRMSLGAGLYMAGATGTDKGVGTINATGLYINNVAVSPTGTAAQYRANTSGFALSTDQVWAAAAEVTLTDAATIAVDLSTFINANLTLGGNRTLGTPSNQKTGQSGCIRIIQDGTGNRTLAYAANWVFANGTAPTLSTAASKQDLLFYHVVAPTVVVGNLVKAII